MKNKDTSPTLSLFSWALYDWANSAFSAVIQTFIFAAYFTSYVAIDTVTGTAQWGYVNSVSALIVACLGPVLGAIADQNGRRKKWLGASTLICIFATAALWFVSPNPNFTLFALVSVGIAITASEIAFIFYNAMLPTLASENHLGRWSGWGWALGYFGGVSCLLAIFFLFFNENGLRLLKEDSQQPVRASFLFGAFWYALFSLPLFFFVAEQKRPSSDIINTIKKGISQLIETFYKVRQYRVVTLFLLGRMFYIDGLTTLFAFGGVFAATIFGMETEEILLFGIGMNIASGVGAFIFARLDDLWGSKTIILISLCCLLISTVSFFWIETKEEFWLMAMILALFVGPVQSSSRAMMARLSPPNLRNEMFGFFALAGKATTFLGPLLVSLFTLYFDSPKAGFTVIIGLFSIGLLMIIPLSYSKYK